MMMMTGVAMKEDAGGAEEEGWRGGCWEYTADEKCGDGKKCVSM